MVSRGREKQLRGLREAVEDKLQLTIHAPLLQRQHLFFSLDILDLCVITE